MMEGGRAMLAEDQFAFFARNGFLRLNALEPQSCARLMEQCWSRLPPEWARDDPASWRGEVTDSCHSAGLAYRRGHLKFQKGALQSDAVAIAAAGPASPLAAAARELLGHDVAVRYRGLYLIAPFAESRQVARFCKPHVEAHPVHLIATGYLHDVPAGAGGLLVWPGSHRALFPTFGSRLEFMAGPDYERLAAEYAQQEPLELTGRAGDVFLIHHRLLHAPSLNFSDRIRMALFCDYIRSDHARLAQQRPGAGMWEDWSPRLAALPAEKPDFALRPASLGDRVGMAPAAANHTTENKRDASRLIRLIGEGELWVTVSTAPALAGTARIEPCGAAQVARLARVSAGGARLRSEAKNDIVAKLPEGAREFAVSRRWLPWRRPVPLWIRVIRVRLPFARSELLAEARLDAAAPAWQWALPAAPDALPPGAAVVGGGATGSSPRRAA
ncbi:phytanoyl-CoA dioxygenase family protein [Falsiroseomonas sp.]|uniref:phytanoyl-CoA dioxygenase family protein n=1 Tax=Falsiroseomonas sp. TaxID=2870721 RepID=UPI0035680E9B